MPSHDAKLARAGEAREVADLGDQSECCQRRDPAKPGEGLDLPGPAPGLRELLELRVERVDLTLDAVKVDQHLLQRELRERVIQALRVDPAAMRQRPRRLALTKHAAVAQQLLEHAGPRAAQIIAAAQQVAQALGLGSRRVHEAQQSRAVQRDELLGVTAIGLDAITRAHGHQRRRDDIAGHSDRRQQPPQRVAAGPGFIADGQALGSAEAVDEATDRALRRLDSRHLRLTAGRRQRRGDDRQLVHIKTDPQTHVGGRERGNVRHGWSSTGRMRLWPCGPQHPRLSTRDRCDARGPAPCRVHTD
jgi:hypothetical protein